MPVVPLCARAQRGAHLPDCNPSLELVQSYARLHQLGLVHVLFVRDHLRPELRREQAAALVKRREPGGGRIQVERSGSMTFLHCLSTPPGICVY